MAVHVEHYYRRFGPMVLRRCRRLLGNEQLAADAMHDVFVLLLRNEHRLRDEAPSSLLYRMATNVALNRIRSMRRRPEVPDAVLLEQIAVTDRDEDRSLAKSILDRLFRTERDSTRTIAVLHLVDGMTLEEVAAEVGLSVSGVRKRLRTFKRRAQALKECPSE